MRTECHSLRTPRSFEVAICDLKGKQARVFPLPANKSAKRYWPGEGSPGSATGREDPGSATGREDPGSATGREGPGSAPAAGGPFIASQHVARLSPRGTRPLAAAIGSARDLASTVPLGYVRGCCRLFGAPRGAEGRSRRRRSKRRPMVCSLRRERDTARQRHPTVGISRCGVVQARGQRLLARLGGHQPEHQLDLRQNLSNTRRWRSVWPHDLGEARAAHSLPLTRCRHVGVSGQRHQGSYKGHLEHGLQMQGRDAGSRDDVHELQQRQIRQHPILLR